MSTEYMYGSISGSGVTSQVAVALLASPDRSRAVVGVVRFSKRVEYVTIHRTGDVTLCPHMHDPNDQPAPHRKQATIIFADLSGFTAMSEDLDPEQVREIVNRYFESLSAAVRRYHGTIDKYIGDCVMAVFGVPATHQNDYERACCAALDMQQSVRDLAATFVGSGVRAPELHIGINTGLVVAGSMGSAERSQYTVMGDAVNLASRLCHEAETGQIAVGEATWELVRDKFNFSAKESRSIKGKSEKVAVYFLQSRNVKSSRTRQSQFRMVGRAREIALAQDLMRDACDRHGSLLYITGDPGIGKSRLSSEMSVWAAENGLHVLTASAQPLETIQAYSLWRQLLEQLSGAVPGANAQHDAALRVTAGLASPEFGLMSEAERFDAIVLAWKDLLHSLQAEQPLLLIMDDLQWADAQSLELLDEMVSTVPSLALLLCAQARPEFRHTWEARFYYHPIVLQPLSSEDSAALVRQTLGDKDLAGGLSRETDVITRAEGNPFYLTELARAAARLGDGKLPPTVQDLIVERIDALEKEARGILEVASVIGRQFPNRLLSAVSGTEHCEAEIRRLQELEFVYQKEIAPELLYLFKHYLTQEATYDSILIQRRKELHKQIAAAIQQEYKESLERYCAVVAQHYEKAGEYQLAFDYYRRAGENALGSQSETAAVGLYERGEAALRLLHADRPRLKNKLNMMKVMLAAGFVSGCLGGALGLIVAQTSTRRGPIHVPEVLVIVISSILFCAAFISMYIFFAGRWSFIVYPDRARLLSKRRTIDLVFDRIMKVEVISYEHGFTPSRMWMEIKLWLNPRYPKFGLGQTGILRGIRQIIRIDCSHGWRKGYALDMETPGAFVATLNRALERYRAIRGAQPS